MLPTLPVMLCPGCGHIDEPALKQGRVSTIVVGAWCKGCNQFLRWLPKRLLPPPHGRPIDRGDYGE